MRGNDDIIIKQAEKGSAVVISDRDIRQLSDSDLYIRSYSWMTVKWICSDSRCLFDVWHAAIAVAVAAT